MKRSIVLIALLGLLVACSSTNNSVADAELAPTIVGGTEVDPPNSYPWMAELRYKGNFLCGGSLIAQTWILTAAHCVDRGNEGDYTVALGQHRRGAGDGTEQYRSAKRIIRHPMYDNGNIDHDIALIELSKSAALNSSVKIVPLADIGSVGQSLRVIGWGITSEGQVSNVLQQVDVTSKSEPDCKNVTGMTITRQRFCAGSDSGGLGICNGDSGGPIFNQGRQQVGIVAKANTCPSSGGRTYAVYTKVSRFTPWISGITNPPPPPAISTFTVSYSSSGASGVQTLRGTTSFGCPTAGSCTGTAPTNQLATIIAYGPKASQGFWSGCETTRTVNGGGKECDVRVRPGKSVSFF